MALNERLSRLREAVMARGGSWIKDYNPFTQDVAVYRIPNDFSIVQSRARKLREMAESAPIAIYNNWRLAGEHLISGPGDMGNSYGSRSEDADKHAGRLAEFGLCPEELPKIKEAVNRWFTGREVFYAVGAHNSQSRRGHGYWGAPGTDTVFWAGGWIENHSIRDYPKVLRLGFLGIKQEITDALANLEFADPDCVRKENFLRAALDVCEAALRLPVRYAELADKMARQTPDAQEKRRLTAMAAACRRVPAQAAETLFEAAQALWFAHIITAGEDGINANSIGRLDQMLQPYYEKDIAAGRLTRQGAIEIMAELACKLYLDYDVQAITLSGTDAAGSDATNEMSRIILEATRAVDFIRDISVRLHTHVPDDFLHLCAEMVIQGGGIPFFFNDHCFLPALISHGVRPEHAWDYAPIGCIELTIPGKANPHAVSGWINAAKWLELAIFNGQDPNSHVQLGPPTGMLTDFDTFEQFQAAYLRQMKHFTDNMVYMINRGELAQREKGPLPYWSVLTDDCIKRGRDITDGGALYNYHSICLLGTANTADSLMALKKLVFEEKRIAKEQLLQALRDNFVNQEGLQQMLLHAAPKYGNDKAEVDELAAWVDNQFIDLLDTYRSALGANFVAHLFSFRCNIEFGLALGATPDGRLLGQPIAYSLSAHQGRDEEGISAMLHSLSRLPHHRAGGASAAIVDLDPKLVQGRQGVIRLKQILRTALEMNIGQLQMNVVTAERLRQAQAQPEKYGQIPVRVAGYSQKFNLLTPELQEHVIARTKHAR